MDYWIKDQIKIPKLGFGTSYIKQSEVVTAVKLALNTGFRLIDTAQIYLNESEVGQGLKESPIPREDIFLTTKIWRDRLSPQEVKKSFQESLSRLKTDYVDLLLIHWPNSQYPLKETLEAFQELKNENKIYYIGVSNFTCDLLQKAKALCPSLLTNQVEYHPLLSQKKMLDLVEKEDIFLTAYSSLMRGKIFKIQQMTHLAKKYQKSIGQITLRWLVEQKNVVSLCRSESKTHIEENFDIFNFELEEEDRLQLFRLNKNKQRIIDPPFSPDWDN